MIAAQVLNDPLSSEPADPHLAFPLQLHTKCRQTQATRLILAHAKDDLIDSLEAVHEPVHSRPGSTRPLRPEPSRVARRKLRGRAHAEHGAPRTLALRREVRRVQAHAHGEVARAGRERVERAVVRDDVHAAHGPVRNRQARPVVERERQARVRARIRVRAGEVRLGLRLASVFDGGE